MSLASLVQKIWHNSVEATAMTIVATPAFALWENYVVGMSDEVSARARLGAGALQYLGLAIAFRKGRDLSLQKFDVSEKGNTRSLHDLAYASMFSVPISLLLYTLGGASTNQIAAGTLTGVVTGALLGPAFGYADDILNDFAQIRRSQRVIPQFFRNYSKKSKALITAGMFTLSLLATQAIYDLTPQNHQGIEVVKKYVQK